MSIVNNLPALHSDEDGPALVFQCRTGKGRTTTAMAISGQCQDYICLVQKRKEIRNLSFGFRTCTAKILIDRVPGATHCDIPHLERHTLHTCVFQVS